MGLRGQCGSAIKGCASPVYIGEMKNSIRSSYLVFWRAINALNRVTFLQEWENTSGVAQFLFSSWLTDYVQCGA